MIEERPTLDYGAKLTKEARRLTRTFPPKGTAMNGEQAAEDFLRRRAPEISEDDRDRVIWECGRLVGKKGLLTYVRTEPASTLGITDDNGWLAPSGRFYPCKYGEHAELALRITNGNTWPENHLEGLGYVKVQRLDERDRPRFYARAAMASTRESGIPKPTSRQIQAVVDRCLALEKPKAIPHWVHEIEEHR